MSVSLAIILNGYQSFLANGLPNNGGFIYTYGAGTTTPTATYTTNTGATPNANPIALGADGRPPQEIWVTDGTSYKFVITDSALVTVSTYDNINWTFALKGINTDITSLQNVHGPGAGGTNTSVGTDALRANSSGATGNTGIGVNALYVNISGISNTAVGYVAGQNISGNYNTAIGYDAISSSGSGGFNTALGKSAGSTLSLGDNNMMLGSNSQPVAASVSNSITLGDASITTLRCNVTVISALSDKRDKKNIVDLPLGLTFINSIRPVKFDWDRRDGTMAGVTEIGFIAQELDTAQLGHEYLGLVLHDNPEKLEATPGKLFPILVKAIQELSTKNAALEARLTAAGIA